MSLTLEEARERAAVVSDVTYSLVLTLLEPETGRFHVSASVFFTCSAGSTFLELSDAEELRVSIDRVETDVAYDGRRIRLSGLGGQHAVDIEASLPYVTDGDGMYLFTDPADGATYASAYVGMDVAQKVFPCFDQNDLKARIQLIVLTDPSWTVLANGRVEMDGIKTTAEGREDRRTWFSTTEPIPTAMFVVCAGPWHSRTWEHAGLPFGWHARASLASELDRDFDELRRVTEACFDHYAEIFTEPMPFDSYDQAFVPGQNWGALETPGCVTFRDEYLPRGMVTHRQRANLANTIAHEMAHMWFGDLVTMTWWEDTWLQESFADYMGYEVSEVAAGYPGRLVGFELTRKATGYLADARRSTHPVAPAAEDVPDVDAAANNFDMISYAKGNAALRQLVTWLGAETFLAGVNTYLTEHRFGNATLADFVDALDAAGRASGRDVVAWADAWLRTSGFDTIAVSRAPDGTPVLTREGSRPHRVGVTSYDDVLGVTDHRWVDLDDEPVAVDGWADRVVLVNVASETFARVRLDLLSQERVLAGLSDLADPLTRAVVWGQLFGALETRELDPADYLAVVAGQLPRETDPSIVAGVLLRTHDRLVPLRLESDDVPAAYRVLARACSEGLAATDDPELGLAFAEGLVATSSDVDLLRGWLDAPPLALPPTVRWRVVERLSRLGALDAGAIEAERVADGSVDGELGAACALAARPSAEAKAGAWAAASEPDVSNRAIIALLNGLWSPEHPDLVAPYVERYLAEAPSISARRGQAFTQIVGKCFPSVPFTAAQVEALRIALAGDLSSVLRRAWEDRLDDLG